MTGGAIVCRTLEKLGVTTLFGLPGTQNVGLIEELRRSSLRFVLATHELSAGFMANGYYRASGKVGVLMTISGPGLTYAITALAEARHDSAALLHITIKADEHPTRRFQLQALKQREMLQPLVKRFIEVTCVDDLVGAIVSGYTEALSGEPGPVTVEISRSVIAASSGREITALSGYVRPKPSASECDSLITRINSATKLVLFCGQGAADAASHVAALADKRNAVVMTTCSGRGIVPEDGARSCYYDFSWGGRKTINAILAEADLIVVLGCKFTHNGTGGFELSIAQDKLIHVDTAGDVLNANYTASMTICADAGETLAAIGTRVEAIGAATGWTADEIARFKQRLHEEQLALLAPSPSIRGTTPGDMPGFFATLRELLPDNAIVVTDSGFHQALTRTHFTVKSPRGMICPTDFQSMGFALPAAIGAQLAATDRPVVVIIGDGGMAMSAMELVTAVREQIPLLVCVFTDGYLGLIRLQQVGQFGQEHAVTLANPDFSLHSEAVGAGYRLAEGSLKAMLREAIAARGVQLIEIDLQDSPGLRKLRAKGMVRQSIRTIAGPRMLGLLKRLLGK